MDAIGVYHDCETITDYWDPDNGTCQLCPGKNFQNILYEDFCQLISDCPEGSHIGFCCPEGTIYRQTGTEVNYRQPSITYSTGVCCPKARPIWNGDMCVPE